MRHRPDAMLYLPSLKDYRHVRDAIYYENKIVPEWQKQRDEYKTLPTLTGPEGPPRFLRAITG